MGTKWGIPVYDRIMARCERIDTGCLIWTGAVTHDGYGMIGVKKKMVRVHKFIYEHHNGPVPAGFELDHTCNERPCVEITHLEVVTHAENMRRKKERRLKCQTSQSS